MGIHKHCFVINKFRKEKIKRKETANILKNLLEKRESGNRDSTKLNVIGISRDYHFFFLSSSFTLQIDYE